MVRLEEQDPVNPPANCTSCGRSLTYQSLCGLPEQPTWTGISGFTKEGSTPTTWATVCIHCQATVKHTRRDDLTKMGLSPLFDVGALERAVAHMEPGTIVAVDIESHPEPRTARGTIAMLDQAKPMPSFVAADNIREGDLCTFDASGHIRTLQSTAMPAPPPPIEPPPTETPAPCGCGAKGEDIHRRLCPTIREEKLLAATRNPLGGWGLSSGGKISCTSHAVADYDKLTGLLGTSCWWCGRKRKTTEGGPST